MQGGMNFEHEAASVACQRIWLPPSWMMAWTRMCITLFGRPGRPATCADGPFLLKIIGASVSEPLSSDLNVNFVCLSVYLSVCLSVMDGPSTYCKSLPVLILRVLRHALIQKPLES